MQTRPLGRTGIQVSAYALGTMMFGPYGNPDPDDCARIVHRALDGGINRRRLRRRRRIREDRRKSPARPPR
jgi:hypothetical protein